MVQRYSTSTKECDKCFIRLSVIYDDIEKARVDGVVCFVAWRSVQQMKKLFAAADEKNGCSVA